MTRRRWMLSILLLFCVALPARTGGGAPSGQAPSARAPWPEAKAKDVENIEAFVAALYGVISGPAGERDWDRLRSLFIPEARMIPTEKKPDGSYSYNAMTVEEFVTLARKYFEEKPFYESEVSRKVERFGQIAHVFSTYESRSARGEKPFQRGINSIQLFYDGKRWWCVTIYWDSERPGNPIPKRYLKK